MQLEIPNRRFAAYLFDCDGTLADTMPLHYLAWKRLIAEQGAAFPEELFYALGGKPTERILELLRDNYGMHFADVPAAAKRKEGYFLERIREVKAIEPVVDIARRLHTRRPMAVVSGGLRYSVESTLDSIGIRSLFDRVVCAEDTARGKPAPDPFLEAARLLDVVPEDCLVFEDSEPGIQAAAAAGMQCVRVPRMGA